MKIIKPGYEILTPISDGGLKELQLIERIGRVCYKSEERITEDGESARKFVKMLIDRGHEAMIEHSLLTVRFTCDRGVSHELVRHRTASYAQESTRYCDYSKGKFGSEITVIAPFYLTEGSEEEAAWRESCEAAEKAYFASLKSGLSPQQARAVLPTCLKTEIVMSANYREWRHVFALRTAPAAHPQMREIMLPLLAELKTRLPIIFDDIAVSE